MDIKSKPCLARLKDFHKFHFIMMYIHTCISHFVSNTMSISIIFLICEKLMNFQLNGFRK